VAPERPWRERANERRKDRAIQKTHANDRRDGGVAERQGARVCDHPAQNEYDSENHHHHPILILDTSTWLPSTGSGPEFIEGSTGFGFSIAGKQL
jgi:hypothetical protein